MRVGVFVLCGLLAACSDPAARRDLSEAVSTKPASNAGDSTLAYEHTITVQLDEEVLPARIRELREACTPEPHGCTLLDVSSTSTRGQPMGSLRMRLAPAGVQAMIALASRDGEVTAHRTHAEDLAEPVADTERQLTLLTTHRDRLAELMKNRTLAVDQLITVSKELASVQTQIDTLTTQRANLRRRIDTELLDISLSLPPQEYEASATPVRDAFREFGTNVRFATAGVVRFLAYVLPWLVVIVPGLLLLRLFWRWITRWLGRREARS
jgi:hypothetical protein